MKFKFPISLTLICLFSGCAITPKGDYHKSKIERPYALPDDIAITSYGMEYDIDSMNNAEKSATKKQEKDRNFLPRLIFEHGIGKNVNWIYPLGIRWGIYQGERHTLGLKAHVHTVFFLSEYSFDYWYKLSPSISIRPYYRRKSSHIIFIDKSSNFAGVEILYQTTEKLALSIYGHAGNHKVRSRFIELIVYGFSGKHLSSEFSGTFKRIGLGNLYSINDKWDIYAKASMANYKLEDYKIKNIAAHLGLNYIW